jgi:hypothetical protein
LARFEDRVLPTVILDEDFLSGVGLLQFALQGTNGSLELAAHGWGPDASTRLHVLQAREGRLVTIGDLPGVAPSERRHSVRFHGQQAFVVTFGPIGGVWIDPLWTIDLSEPAEPRVMGELEIPGFSGVTFAEDGWSWSEAFGNHHAISYFPETGVLAIPMTTVGSGIVVRHGWHNFDQPTDVNLYGVTTPLDALLVINEINRSGIGPLGPVPDQDSQAANPMHPLLDVNRDGHLTPLDVLITVNELNERADRLGTPGPGGSDASPEAESAGIASQPLLAWNGWPARVEAGRNPPGQPAPDILAADQHWRTIGASEERAPLLHTSAGNDSTVVAQRSKYPLGANTSSRTADLLSCASSFLSLGDDPSDLPDCSLDLLGFDRGAPEAA